MSKFYFPELGLVFVAFVWGITFVVVKNVIGFMAPFTFNCLRFFLAALLLFAWILIYQPKTLSKIDRIAAGKGLILGLWLFLGFGFLSLGLVHTSASNAGFITGLNVVLIPFFSVFLIKQKMNRYTLFGMLAASLGLYFLTIKGSLSLNKGDFLIFCGAVAFSFHVIFTGKFAKQSPAFLLVLIQLFFVGLFSCICAMLFEDLSVLLDIDIMLSHEIILAMLIVVLLATGLALMIQTHSQKKVAPAKVALIYSLEPVFAAFSGYFWAGDIFGPSSIIGCLLIFSGMIIVDLPQHIKFFVRLK
jgi:drug/metabolite transporter (DMT)-like permease